LIRSKLDQLTKSAKEIKLMGIFVVVFNKTPKLQVRDTYKDKNYN